MFKIQTLNKISAKGLNEFPREDYEVASSLQDADAILVRSQDMHQMDLPGTVKAVARAGAGTNNIPIPEFTKKGIVVFNTPGANANAVKELVILGILLASRPVIKANKWVNGLAGKGDEIAELATAFNNMANSLQNLENMRSSFVSNVNVDLPNYITPLLFFATYNYNHIL